MTAVEPKMHVQYPVRYKTVRVNDQDIFRLVAPDYPGYGQTACRITKRFYTASAIRSATGSRSSTWKGSMRWSCRMATRTKRGSSNSGTGSGADDDLP